MFSQPRCDSQVVLATMMGDPMKECVMSRDEIETALMFLSRVTARGVVEEEALVQLIAKLEKALGLVPTHA